MKRFVSYVGVLLLVGLVVSCGGGGGGGDSAPPGGAAPTPAQTPAPTPPTAASKPGRFEETDAKVTLSPGDWVEADSRFGWSGGGAMQSTVAGATATFQFSGTSVTWIGARSDGGGTADISVDGGPARQISLVSRPNEKHAPVVTLHDLSPGQHTLTIRVTSAAPAVVVVDAFDVEAPIVSHKQENDPDVAYTGTWIPPDLTNADPCAGNPDPTCVSDPHEDHSGDWSGGGVQSAPEPVRGGARFTTTAGDALTFTFRGTSITWQSGRGPDFGIATVQLDGGPAVDVDTYFPTPKFQEVVFRANGLANGTHTLTITATDRRNGASTGNKIVVDAFDVTTLGRRFQEDDTLPNSQVAATTYTGTWSRNINRVWSEGATQRADAPGSIARFTFRGTGVSYIGCQKNSIGPVIIRVDGVFKGQIKNALNSPREAYMHEIFGIDGLDPSVQHTIEVESVSATSFIVVDAFDVRGGPQ
ncbi:MAG TPA: hypothetical protein VGF58_10025 [Burkholderiales bacterium]